MNNTCYKHKRQPDPNRPWNRSPSRPRASSRGSVWTVAPPTFPPPGNADNPQGRLPPSPRGTRRAVACKSTRPKGRRRPEPSREPASPGVRPPTSPPEGGRGRAQSVDGFALRVTVPGSSNKRVGNHPTRSGKAGRRSRRTVAAVKVRVGGPIHYKFNLILSAGASPPLSTPIHFSTNPFIRTRNVFINSYLLKNRENRSSLLATILENGREVRASITPDDVAASLVRSAL